MNLQKIYTALLIADLAAAEAWYTKLLGRGPDHRPMDTLVQWELFDQGGLMLSSSDEIAGTGVMFLYVNDVAAERRRLLSLGIVLGDDIEGDYPTLAQVRDPDGNLLTLGEWKPPRAASSAGYISAEYDTLFTTEFEASSLELSHSTRRRYERHRLNSHILARTQTHHCVRERSSLEKVVLPGKPRTRSHHH